ncbi:hypothetical protein ACFLY0_01855 [Patescibacteria group bacterium]
MEKNTLHKKIMRNIYAIFILQKIINPTAFKLYVVMAFAWVGTLYVSFGNVFANMQSLSGASALYKYSISSFANTELIVQVLSVAMLVALVWFVRDIFKTSHANSFLHEQNIA